MTAIDFTPILNPLIQIVGLALMGAVGWAATRVAKYAHVSATSQLAQMVVSAVDNGINFAVQKAQAQTARIGTVQTADATVATAVNYVITKVPGTLKSLGIDVTTTAGQQHVADLITARLPTT